MGVVGRDTGVASGVGDYAWKKLTKPTKYIGKLINLLRLAPNHSIITQPPLLHYFIMFCLFKSLEEAWKQIQS